MSSSSSKLVYENYFLLILTDLLSSIKMMELMFCETDVDRSYEHSELLFLSHSKVKIDLVNRHLE